jgi:menaquinone-dependent protoporphyrinogen oxidase
MPSHRILIVYGTSHGQTAKVARYLAELLTAAGDAVTLSNVDALPRGPRPSDFDGVMVGSPILFGRHRRAIRRFVLAHRDALNDLPSAFFSVSGSAAGRTEAERGAARACVEEFLRETGWRPALTETIAGAMAYTKYSPLTRWLLKRIAAKAGGPTDVSRDHEFTDWEQVRRFAEAFGAMLPGRSEPRALVTT